MIHAYKHLENLVEHIHSHMKQRQSIHNNSCLDFVLTANEKQLHVFRNIVCDFGKPKIYKPLFMCFEIVNMLINFLHNIFTCGSINGPPLSPK